MDRSLYFIPLIAKAVGESNPKRALIDAFKEIEILSKDSRYLIGFDNFLAFMKKSAENWMVQNGLETNAIDYTGSELTRILIEKKYLEDPDALSSDFYHGLEQGIGNLSLVESNPPPVQLLVNCNHIPIATIQVVPHKAVHRIANVYPGYYEFELECGWLLWAARLSENDLVMTTVFPDENLKMAADTGEISHIAPSREVKVLNGELVIRIIPGLEDGWLEIDTRKLW